MVKKVRSRTATKANRRVVRSLTFNERLAGIRAAYGRGVYINRADVMELDPTRSAESAIALLLGHIDRLTEELDRAKARASSPRAVRTS